MYISSSNGLISYYKVNFTKSFILKLGVSTNDQKLLLQQFPYLWSSTGIPYLGTTLTPTISNFAESNFKPLITKLETELRHLSHFKLSWSGCLLLLKCSFSHRFLYFFCTLPIPLKPSLLSSLSSLLKKFIWQQKIVICFYTQLIKHKKS